MLLLTEQLRDALMQYLATKPYAEVAQAIAALNQLPQAPTEESAE